MLVPVTGTVVEQIDPDRLEALVRNVAQRQDAQVDEAELARVTDLAEDGPFLLNVDQRVQVSLVGDTWLICEPSPSSAPQAP
jgi:hypothetical protein